MAEVSIARVRSLFKALGADRVLLVGPPGVGKSQTVRVYAEEQAARLGLEFVDARSLDVSGCGGVEGKYLFLHLFAPTLRPEDLAFVAKRGDRYDFVLPRHLEYFTCPGARGLIFIDEITNVQLADVLTALFSLVLDKTIAGYKLSDDVEVVAAGNAPDESSVANLLPAPLVDRFRLVVRVAPPSVTEWARWMEERYGDDWDRRVLGFLLGDESSLAPRGESEGLEKYPTPRTWTEVALMLPRIPEDDMLFVLSFALGRKYGGMFYDYLRTEVDVDRLLRGDRAYFDGLSIRAKYIALFQAASQIVKGKSPCVFARDVLAERREWLIVLVKMMKAIDAKAAAKAVFGCKYMRDAWGKAAVDILSYK